jgi:hypothetical protein
MKPSNIPPQETIEQRIHWLRGQKVMLDSSLAGLYGVSTKQLVQAAKRNLDRFPEDFMFQLEPQEFKPLRSQIVTSNVGRGEPPLCALRFHRTRRGHAFQCSPQQARHQGQCGNHARLCQNARRAYRHA